MNRRNYNKGVLMWDTLKWFQSLKTNISCTYSSSSEEPTGKKSERMTVLVLTATVGGMLSDFVHSTGEVG